ncbi:MAG: TIM barrel protein [Polyangiaceae bacterium]|nr:TIM barrel protein [Polyangiaceae bacterium]
MRIQQSFCYPVFQPIGSSLSELFGYAQRVGYRAIELWDRGADFEEVVETARRHELTIASMSGHGNLERGTNDEREHTRIEAELTESLHAAARTGVRGLICLSGNRLAGQGPEAAAQASAKILRKVAPLAEELGVNLNLEVLNSKVDHPGYECDSVAATVRVLELTGSPMVKMLFDIYHVQIMEGDVIRKIEQHIQHIGHFHTAGNPERRDLDDEQELNYRGICKAIARTHYAGYVGHEFRPKVLELEALRRNFEVCDA